MVRAINLANLARVWQTLHRAFVEHTIHTARLILVSRDIKSWVTFGKAYKASVRNHTAIYAG